MPEQDLMDSQVLSLSFSGDTLKWIALCSLSCTFNDFVASYARQWYHIKDGPINCLIGTYLLRISSFIYSVMQTQSSVMSDTLWSHKLYSSVWTLGQEDPLEKEMAKHSCNTYLENSMDRRAWRAMVHRVTKE